MKKCKLILIAIFLTQIFPGCKENEPIEPKTYAVMINVNLFKEYAMEDEWIHLQITKEPGNDVIYDTLAIVKLDGGFSDEINLEPGSYKCFILDMGAIVQMPIIKLYNGQTVDWGYPAIEAYVFDLPVKQ